MQPLLGVRGACGRPGPQQHFPAVAGAPRRSAVPAPRRRAAPQTHDCAPRSAAAPALVAGRRRARGAGSRVPAAAAGGGAGGGGGAPPAAPPAAAAEAWAVVSTQESPAASADGGEPPAFHESYYDWRWNSRIRYYTAGDSGPLLLLVHGFGVGGYHFDRNFRQLSARFRVVALDLLGQGGSWPASAEVEPDPELGPLMYSADVWTLQLLEFLRGPAGAAPGEAVYVAGNSLGGYLAVNLAARHPDLVKGLVLLNATPFWSFRNGGDSPGLWESIKLDGTVPVPKTVKSVIERLWWRNLSSPDTVSSLLSLVYASPVNDERLLRRILEATEHPGAIDAFASIVLSPKTKSSFGDNIKRLRCPVLLAYGRDDPWVVPLWGQRFKRAVPHAAYYELSGVGHCPHHEAPNAVNRVLSEWIAAVEERLGASGGGSSGVSSRGRATGQGAAWARSGADPLLVDGPLRVGQSMAVPEAHGAEVVVTHVEGAPRNTFERVDAAVAAAWRSLGGEA